MKLLKLVLIFGATFLFIASCTKTDAPNGNSTNSAASAANTDPAVQTSPVIDKFAAAKNIYDKKCIKCHQETGEGGKIQIDTVALKVPNFRDPRNQDDDDADYIERVEKGASGKMPAFKGKLTDDEIKSVVGYIRHEFQGK
ncbi:MAG: cytochrome c [Pyrinomonadaceae bacterium]